MRKYCHFHGVCSLRFRIAFALGDEHIYGLFNNAGSRMDNHCQYPNDYFAATASLVCGM
jgi:hypothetical protein